MSNTPSPRWASVRLPRKYGRLATIWTLCRARKAARSACERITSTVRLQRSITRQPSPRTCSTNQRKLGFNSGAPPVRSTEGWPIRSIASRHSSNVSRDMFSCVRSGPASTWQCLQVWLQNLPTLIWTTSMPPATSGPTPARARRESNGSKAASASSCTMQNCRSVSTDGRRSAGRELATDRYMLILEAMLRICKPCTSADPPLIAEATCTASVICSRLEPCSRQPCVYASMQ